MEGEHSIAHAAAAVVGVCVHGDNMLACILRLIADSEKTIMTMLGTDVDGSKHPSFGMSNRTLQKEMLSASCSKYV